LLELPECLAQRAIVPDADVPDGRLVALQLPWIETSFDGMKSHANLVQTVSRSACVMLYPRKGVSNWSSLGSTVKALKTPWNHDRQAVRIRNSRRWHIS